MVRVEVVPSSMTMIFSVKALSPHPFVLTPDQVRGKHRPFLLTRCRKNGPSTSSGRTDEAAGNHLAIPCNICHMIVQRSMAERSAAITRSEEHTSELQSLMRISYAVFCLKNTTVLKTL